MLSKFEDAMKQGYVDKRYGSDGIIKLTDNEMKDHKGYTYKLKVARASNHYRVFGKIETFINEDKKEMPKLVFSKVITGKNAD